MLLHGDVAQNQMNIKPKSIKTMTVVPTLVIQTINGDVVTVMDLLQENSKMIHVVEHVEVVVPTELHHHVNLLVETLPLDVVSTRSMIRDGKMIPVASFNQTVVVMNTQNSPKHHQLIPVVSEVNTNVAKMDLLLK